MQGHVRNKVSVDATRIKNHIKDKWMNLSTEKAEFTEVTFKTLDSGLVHNGGQAEVHPRSLRAGRISPMSLPGASIGQSDTVMSAYRVEK